MMGSGRVKLHLDEQALVVLEQISEGMPGGFFIYQADEIGEILYINRTMLHIFGCETRAEFEELTGNTFRGLVHPADYESVDKSIENQIENSVYDLDYVEYRIIRKDGTVRWLEDYGHLVNSKLHGEIFYVFVQDVTDRLKQRMEELEKLNEELQGAYAKETQYRKAILSDAVTFFEINLTQDSFLTKVSQVRSEEKVDLINFAKSSNFSRYSDYVKFQADYIDSDDSNSYWRFFDIDRLIRCYGRGELEQTYDCWVKNVSGGRRLLHYVLLLGKNEHTEDVIALSVTKDMTEQLERQQLLRSALQQAKVASVAREVFLSNMSHDIRTPLNAIIGYVELAKRSGKNPDKLMEYIDKIGHSGEQLLSILNESLELTRIESGRVSLTKEPFCLKELLEDVQAAMWMQAEAKSIRFTIDKTGLEHYDVVSDFMRIKELITQLVDNAIKYTPEGGTVSVVAAERDIHLDGYRQYQFVVEDNGIGISNAFQETLFEPFARENNTTQSGVLGTGLGLALVKSIVDMLDGDIEVESRQGEGSRFCVTVLFRLQGEHGSETVRNGSSECAELRNVRILMAEDNEINREIAEELLRDSGYMVETAKNGQQALDKLVAVPPDYYSLILMDIQMPIMDGYEATRKIRAMEDKHLAQIPIVALSANAFAEDYQKSREAGMDAHLAKPIDVKKVCDVINRLLQQ